MSDQAGEGQERAADDVAEDLPTVPPAPRGSSAGLRWATFPLERPPAHVGTERYLPGPPTALVPVASGGPEVRRGDDATGPGGAVETAGGPPGPARKARRHVKRVKVVLLVAAVAFVAAVGATATVLGTAATNAPRQTSARALAPQTVFQGFLAVSASAHQLVAAAIGASCRPAPPGTASRQVLIGQVGRAAALRRSVLDGIAADRKGLLAMHDGRSLVGDLEDATEASLSADQGYEAWLEDLQATGCYGAPTNDIHYRAASEASLAATGAKQRLVAVWAGVASQYGLRSWAAGQL